MIQFLLVLIFISAAISLMSYVYCWQDIKSGRPHIISLRQITSIMDRNHLNACFGNPEPGYYYSLAPGVAEQMLRQHSGYYYRECAADITCIIGAWWFSISEGSTQMLYGFIALASICQLVNVAYSWLLLKKWGHQIREELDNSDD